MTLLGEVMVDVGDNHVGDNHHRQTGLHAKANGFNLRRSKTDGILLELVERVRTATRNQCSSSIGSFPAQP